MSYVELLTVEERFQLSPIGLTIVPDFDVPAGVWQNFEAQVRVVNLADGQIETSACFDLVHFNISDPKVSMEKRWRVVVRLPHADKSQVPIGSRLLVMPATRDAVLIGSSA